MATTDTEGLQADTFPVIRPFLAYRDGLLRGMQVEQIERQISENQRASQLNARIRQVVQEPQEGLPIEDSQDFRECSEVARYLENVLPAEKQAQVEQACWQKDGRLAEVAACHTILSQLVKQSVHIHNSTKQAIRLRCEPALAVTLPEVAKSSETQPAQSTEENVLSTSKKESAAKNAPAETKQTPQRTIKPTTEDSKADLLRAHFNKVQNPNDVELQQVEINAAEEEEDAQPWYWRHRKALTAHSSAIILHALTLLLLGLLLLPMDGGDGGSLELSVALSEETLDDSASDSLFDSESQEIESQSFETDPSFVEEDFSSIEIPSFEDSMLESFEPSLDGGALGGGEEGGGGGESGGDGQPRGEFFGIASNGMSFAYVLDASDSMSGARFERAIKETLYSVNELTPDQRFFVIFFNHGTYPMFYEPDDRFQRKVRKDLIPATPENRYRLKDWLSKATPFGGTIPEDALLQMINLRPDVIFFLSDGEFDNQTVDKVREANADKGVIIYTIGLESGVGEHLLKDIAYQNGGEYRFVE
ncbi:Hypothetical protein PBC10988_35230 [Planctomycetales bacterium 10988]|nr:Hypothetical protein PBC10988_35230 [Planctomycetales bacterium 10988]